MRAKPLLVLLTAALLLGCGHAEGPMPTPVITAPPPWARPGRTRGAVTASGEVVPAQEARLGFALAGQVEAVPVTVGDRVTVGQPLVRLRTAEMESGVLQARAQLEVARADLALVQASPVEVEITAAEAGVSSAEGQLAVAREGVESAQAAVERAEEQIALAQAGLAELTADPTEHELEIARHQIKRAENELWAAQARRDAVCGRVGRGATEADCDSAKAAVGSAYEAVQIAEQQLAQLEGGPTEAQLSRARAQVRIAQAQKAGAEAALVVVRAQIEPARAAVRQAEAQLAQVQRGASTKEIKVERARAAVSSAEAGVSQAQAALEGAVLKAPFDGTVTTLDVAVGEAATPGAPLLTLADLEHLRVETTDLSERDVAAVEVGQKAAIYVEALDKEVAGHVVRIADEASTIGGDVVYTVVIELDEEVPGLRWGMSVEVDIDTGE
ncbi:MAG: HlyD family efflux transporter periplasmic adaptor subunit [Chloroflexota bacterium]|nr:HlyD family efflux transporter periplasmic adaptor subunit [Chloroflexota bacterium]